MAPCRISAHVAALPSAFSCASAAHSPPAFYSFTKQPEHTCQGKIYINIVGESLDALPARFENKPTSGAGGKLVMLLEGGYSMQGLSEGVCESFAALLGRPSIHPHDPEVPSEPLQAAQLALDDVTALHGLAN